MTTPQQRPRLSPAMILLVAHHYLPRWLYRPLVRAYRLGSETRLAFLAARPARYRLMVQGPFGGPAEEWVRYVGQWKIPTYGQDDARRRLLRAEAHNPDCAWWVEHVPGARWHRPERLLLP